MVKERKTPYTNGLIPKDSPLYKLQGKTRKYYEEYPREDWADKELEIHNKFLKSNSYELGYYFAEISRLASKIDEILRCNNEHEFMIETIKKSLEDKSYVNFLEEERYGVRPEPNKTNISNLINDEVIIGYITERHGLNKGLAIKEILK